MKNQRRSGFIAGFAAAVLVMGLTGSAFAVSNRTIPVDGDIRLSINGADFIPVDVNGTEVEVFTYNGTTYAPVRAICEAVGLDVQYDSRNRIAKIVDPNARPAASYISSDAARQAAFSHAGVSGAEVSKCHLKWEHGCAVYDVEFYAGTTEYEYEIDALTSAVLKAEQEHHAGHHGGSAPSGAELISAGQAQSIALEKAPSAAVVKCKLDFDGGKYKYEIELRDGRTEYECEIDAETGRILSWDVDYD